MITYNLGANEVVLYKGEITMLGKQQTVKLVLTNENIVFGGVNQDNHNEEVYSINSIKMYKGVPQIIIKGHNVELYLTTKVIEFSFIKKSELLKFRNAAIELLTGKTKVERGAEKVKGAIHLIDDTLNIDIVKATGNLISTNVSSLVEKVGDATCKAIEGVGDTVNKKVKNIGNIGGAFKKVIGKKKEKQIENNTETIVIE